MTILGEQKTKKDLRPILLQPGRLYKLDLKVTRNTTTYISSNKESKVSLMKKWSNAKEHILPNYLESFELLPRRYLLPYNHDEQEDEGDVGCENLYQNCLSCTSDVKCGWDEYQRICVDRRKRSNDVVLQDNDEPLKVF